MTTTVIDEDELDKYLATTAKKKGWAENKLLHAARILRYVSQHENDIAWCAALKIVIRYLEEDCKVEKQVE